MRGEGEPALMLGRIVHFHPEPVGLKAPGPVSPARTHALDDQRVLRQPQGLVHAAAAIACLEGQVDQHDVEPEEAEYRPGAHQRENEPRAERHRDDRAHEDDEAPGAQAAVGLEPRGKDRSRVRIHPRTISRLRSPAKTAFRAASRLTGAASALLSGDAAPDASRRCG